MFMAIADAIEADLRGGRLYPGLRMPTHRELAEVLGVARGTVTRAYAEAERRGALTSHVGRGTFVAGTEASPTRTLGAPRSELIDLSVNYPLQAHDPDLAAALGELSRRRDLQALLRYQSNAGAARHRAAGAAWAGRHGLDVAAASIVVCGGAQHALFAILAAIARPEDVILTEALVYPGLREAARLLGLRLVPVALDEEGIVPAALAAACRRRKPRALYCTPTMQNPSTGVLSEGRRRAIVAIARAHDLRIVEDDIHRLFVPDAPPPLTALAPERGYFIAGLSKAVAGGLRVAFAVAPVGGAEAVANAVWASTWMVPPLMAELACGWIHDGTADRTLARKREEARARVQLARQRLHGGTLAAQEHGLYGWLGLPSAWTSARFTAAARLRGVAVTPSETFALRDPAPAAVRVCTGAPDDRATLMAGLDALAELLAGAPGPGPAIV